MNYCFCLHHATKGKVRLERQRAALTIFREGRRGIVCRDEVHGVAVPTKDVAELIGISRDVWMSEFGGRFSETDACRNHVLWSYPSEWWKRIQTSLQPLNSGVYGHS